MPVQLTEEALRDAVAVLGERDADGAPGARSALEWLDWHGEGPLLLRRYDVQLFCWGCATTLGRCWTRWGSSCSRVRALERRAPSSRAL